MFRDDQQRGEVCRVLLAFFPVALEPLWDTGGPTDTALVHLEDGGSHLSAGERVIVLLCWALWNNDSTVTVTDLLRLDRDKERAVGELIAARATDAASIDRWIAKYRSRD